MEMLSCSIGLDLMTCHTHEFTERVKALKSPKIMWLEEYILHYSEFSEAGQLLLWQDGLKSL